MGRGDPRWATTYSCTAAKVISSGLQQCRRYLVCNNVNSKSRPDATWHLLFIILRNELSIQRLSPGQSLSNSHKIWIFRYGATALYALTVDSTGRNLPLHAFPEGWQFERSITLRLDRSSPKHDLIKATLAAIGKHGFYLTHAALLDLPLDLDALGFTAPTVPDSAPKKPVASDKIAGRKGRRGAGAAPIRTIPVGS